ncbi:MAG: DnaJ domain-containing protein [Methylotenera sp.]|nr:DnaJ domain-containing protein [Flavobacterium sp.]
MKDYYKILEIEFGADIQSVKKAYRRLALKYHPDKNKAPDASVKFIEITEAYEVLNNDIKKNQYDNLYSSYFKTAGQRTENREDVKTEKTQEWTNYGKKKAEEYASMKYDDFADRIIDELRLGIGYTPNIIFILICGIGVVSSFYIMAEVSGVFGLIMLVMYGTACYFLYERAKKDYIAERRHKILNKYK